MLQNEVFTELKDGCPIDVKMKYPILGMKNAVKGCYFLKTLYETRANLPSEWWHYNYGNGNRANYRKSKAIYKGIFNISELIVE